MLEWEKEGKVPAGWAPAVPAPRLTPATTATPADAVPSPGVVAATPSPAVASASMIKRCSVPLAAAPVTRAAAAPGGAPPFAAGIPRKPYLASDTPSTSVPGPAGRGRGRGRGGAMRGALPAAGGVSIMGAVGKRARDENDVGDALAMRLRPAKGGMGWTREGRCRHMTRQARETIIVN